MEQESTIEERTGTTEQESLANEQETNEQESIGSEQAGAKEAESSFTSEVQTSEAESTVSEGTGATDSEGGKREITWADDLQVENDATVGGTLRAHKECLPKGDRPMKNGNAIYSTGAAYAHTPTHIGVDDSRHAEGKVDVTLLNADGEAVGSASSIPIGMTDADKAIVAEEGKKSRSYTDDRIAALGTVYIGKGDSVNYAQRAGSAVHADRAANLDSDSSDWKKIMEMTGDKYLRKDQDDETDHTLAVGALKTKTFDGDGFIGHGARIDKEGNLVAKSIYAREFMSAPKFVFNEISVTNAEQWSTNAYGTILSVDRDKRLITLKLEENEYGSVKVGDICRGMYADIGNEYNSDSNSEGAVDECGFTVHKGFFTTYFCVTEIVTNEKGSCVFRYKKRVPSGPDPCKFMDFAQYGSFTDTSRQSSMFMSSRGQSYHMILAGVNDWMIRPQTRVACYGCLDGITVLMKDGSEQELKGYGIYVQKNVYFGGAVVQLKDISDLEDLQKMAGAYDVQLSNYAGVITVDDLGNVIGGLYTTNSNGDKQYRLATTTYVRKGDEILTYEPDDTLDEPTEGHYRLQVISEDCTVEVHNSTAYITAIRNLRDGVSGTDEEIDYDKMRKMNACRVTLIVELEGKTVKSIEYPIRIAHDSLPFMLCDLTNEHDSVSWNTKERKYIGFPVETGISMLYHNDPYDIATVEVTNLPSGLKTTVTDNGKRKNITLAIDGTKDGDFLLQTQDINIHVTSIYAGAVYEYDKTFTLDKKSDAVIWDIIPSSDCIVAGKDGKLSSDSLGVDIYGTSTDDKRFKVAFADITKYGLTLWYKKASDTSETQVTSDTSIPVAKGDMSVTFILKNSKGGIEDKEEVPVVAWGEDGKGVEFIYKRTENGATLSPSDNPTPSDWESPTSAYQTNTEYVSSLSALGWTDNPQGADSTHNIEYVCVRKSVNGVWGRFSDPAPFATFTTGVKSINTFYGVFSEGTSPSDGTGFTYDTIDKAVILGNAGKYVWSADFVTYSDGKTEWKDFILVGKCDDIATVEEQYAVTDSPTDIPTENSNWSSSLSGIMSQITNGKALWSCDYVTYRNNSGTKRINIQFVGSAGKKGEQGNPGADGSDGDTTCDLFISSVTQPDAPTVSSVYDYKNGNNLGNWSKTQPSLSADAGVPLTMENLSSNSHNWIQVGAGKFMSPSSQGNSETSIIKVSFYANTSTSVTFNIFTSSEANYDFGYCSNLDSANSGYDNAYEKVSGESASKDVTFSVSAGSHYVYFGYRKDGSGSKGDDRVTVSLITSRIWKSSRIANGSSFSGSWSTPAIVASASLPGAPGEGGEKGSRGPMPRTYDSIKANTWYYSGADGEQEQSFVYSQGTGKWYECISTFYANSSVDPKDDSTHFTLANNFENVATKVLLAQRAKIDNLYVDDVNIVDDSNNVLAKMNKDGITCNTGTFNDVTVNGTINSTDGSIGGMKLAKFTMQSSRIDEGDWNADYSQCAFDNGMAIGTKGFVIGDIWSAVSMGKLACSFGIKYVDGESTLPNYRYIHGTIPSNTHQIHDIALLVQYRQQTSPAVVYSNGYGALTVDSNGVGIESLSQNAFGGMALGTIVSSSLTSSETDAINKNRVSYLVMKNGAETTISLPSQPMMGQRFTVIQGNSGNIKFNSNKIIQTGGKVYYSSGSTRPHSGTTGQWNEFLFDGTVWRASYHQGTL